MPSDEHGVSAGEPACPEAVLSRGVCQGENADETGGEDYVFE